MGSKTRVLKRHLDRSVWPLTEPIRQKTGNRANGYTSRNARGQSFGTHRQARCERDGAHQAVSGASYYGVEVVM
jgi:hypothetical protein